MTPETLPAATPGLAASSALRVLAFDVGGTWVKYGIVDAQGRLLFSDQLATQSEPDGKALLVRLPCVAEPPMARYAPAGVAFATLGIIDAALGVPVVVENDGNCVALATAGHQAGLLGAARLWLTQHGGVTTPASND